MRLDEVMALEPYALERGCKRAFLVEQLNALVRFHCEHSKEYCRILKALGVAQKRFESLESFPYLPVRLFKEYALKSVPDEAVFKTLTSSGTTSQKLSKIFLDAKTSTLQSKALVRIMQDFLGKKRLPMLIIDTPSVLKDRKSFSARGAGILGLASFGRKPVYALNEKMELDWKLLEEFLAKYGAEPFFIFGFTFMIWQYFYEPLRRAGKRLNMQNGILIHSGGWKKLQEQAVDNETFKRSLASVTGLRKIHNFYGMVEQVGSIFVECEKGHLHAPNFADLIIRDPLSLEPLPFGKEGLIEVLSVLPHSYPGHILLTEDLGTVLGEDDCPCGRKGKYFSVKGRLPKAELRGCSDTHAYGAGGS
jgi:phenylacetate-coenzyme A ligase PaaK-like adenylate-forming protein